MNRRTLLGMGASAAALALAAPASMVMAADQRLLLADLEPDGMWHIYSRYRLMIVGQRDDEIGIALAGSVVEVLADALPASRAQLARAADSRRVGVLIGTNQQDVAIMSAQCAEALFLAKPPFDDIRDVPLRLIVSFKSHVLACRSDLLERHVYLLAQTLAQHKDALPTPARAPEGVVPIHEGSHAFFTGQAVPSAAGNVGRVYI
jgi:hypothetical protein